MWFEQQLLDKNIRTILTIPLTWCHKDRAVMYIIWQKRLTVSLFHADQITASVRVSYSSI